MFGVAAWEAEEAGEAGDSMSSMVVIIVFASFTIRLCEYKHSNNMSQLPHQPLDRRIARFSGFTLSSLSFPNIPQLAPPSNLFWKLTPRHPRNIVSPPPPPIYELYLFGGGSEDTQNDVARVGAVEK